MTATDIENFMSAVGEMADAMASFRKTVAYQAEVAGMMAENAHRAACGNSPAYAEDAFFYAAKKYAFGDQP